jgi:tagatose-1,6-bisphosphate aldolase non-catalytic subunit AgaZ/GatZ
MDWCDVPSKSESVFSLSCANEFPEIDTTAQKLISKLTDVTISENLVSRYLPEQKFQFEGCDLRQPVDADSALHARGPSV